VADHPTDSPDAPESVEASGASVEEALRLIGERAVAVPPLQRHVGHVLLGHGHRQGAICLEPCMLIGHVVVRQMGVHREIDPDLLDGLAVGFGAHPLGDRLRDQFHVHVEPHRRDMTRLDLSENRACSTDLEVPQRQSEPRSEVAGLAHGFQAAVCGFGERGLGMEQVGVGSPSRPSHPASKLM